MRMCVAQYPAVRAVLAEYAENAAHVAAFLRTACQFIRDYGMSRTAEMD